MSTGTGSKPTAEHVRGRWSLVAIGSIVALAVLLVAIVPRADEVGQALERVGAGQFIAVVVLGILSLVLRTVAWQIAVDAAGGDVHAREAHAASAANFAVALVNPYLGSATRIAILRRAIPDRSPTTAQLIAAESALFVVEASVVAVLVLCASWTLDVPFYVALLILIGSFIALAALVWAARRWATSRFASGLAVARQPSSLAAVTAATGGAILAQLGRVAVALSAVDLDASPIVVIAVFVASGVSILVPIGTAAAGAAAPLIAAAGSGGEDVADASAAGVLLSGSLMVSALLYLLVAGFRGAELRRSLGLGRKDPGRDDIL